MEIIKNQFINELLEQHVQVTEYYYEVLLFEPLKMWSMLHKSISLCFPDIFKDRKNSFMIFKLQRS